MAANIIVWVAVWLILEMFVLWKVKAPSLAWIGLIFEVLVSLVWFLFAANRLLIKNNHLLLIKSLGYFRNLVKPGLNLWINIWLRKFCIDLWQLDICLLVNTDLSQCNLLIFLEADGLSSVMFGIISMLALTEAVGSKHLREVLWVMLIFCRMIVGVGVS